MVHGAGQERIPPSLRGVLEWERSLCHGAGGHVDLCHHVHLDTRVVLKWAITPFGANEDLNARFRRESKTLSQVSHPRIVRLLDCGEHDGLAYLVFEYIEGPTLGEFLEPRGRLSWSDALSIVLEMAEGLAEIHPLGILHRDIKPTNTVLHETRGAVLIDFGLVKTGAEATALTAANVPLGTPAYVAPEIVKGTAVGPPADVYSLGIVLHHLVAGKVPFLRESVFETLEAQVHEAPPEVPGLPAPVARLLASCLSKDPADRPQDGREMLFEGRQVQKEMVALDQTRSLDPEAVRQRARARENAQDATMRLGVVHIPRPSRIWHGLARHMGLAAVTLLLFLGACLYWRMSSRDESLDRKLAEEMALAGRLVSELRELGQRGELEVASRELAYGRTISPASRRFLEDANGWLARSREPVIAVLESRTAPPELRWELYDLLAPLEGLERAMPTEGVVRGLEVASLRNRFIVTRITDTKEGARPEDGEMMLADFKGLPSMLLVPGLDREALLEDMARLATEQKEVVESLQAEFEWSGIPRARRIRMPTRCQGPGSCIDVVLAPGRRVRVWGRGNPIDMGNIGNLEGWISNETPALKMQMLEVALPHDALEPGVHRLEVTARTLAPPIPGKVDCIPAIGWIAIDR